MKTSLSERFLVALFELAYNNASHNKRLASINRGINKFMVENGYDNKFHADVFSSINGRNVCVEYNSRVFHSLPETVASDAKKDAIFRSNNIYAYRINVSKDEAPFTWGRIHGIRTLFIPKDIGSMKENGLREVIAKLTEKIDAATGYVRCNSFEISDVCERATELSKTEGGKYLDNNGIPYNTKVEMCRAHGITTAQYNYRIKRGYSQAEALSKTISYHTGACDFKGNYFTNRKEMAQAYNVAYATFNARLKAGYSLEAALTGNTNGEKVNYTVYDHTGRGFASEQEMCSAWNVKYSTYKYRVNEGWPMRFCLESILKDDFGKVYFSFNAFCKAKGMTIPEFIAAYNKK